MGTVKDVGLCSIGTFRTVVVAWGLGVGITGSLGGDDGLLSRLVRAALALLLRLVVEAFTKVRRFSLDPEGVPGKEKTGTELADPLPLPPRAAAFGGPLKLLASDPLEGPMAVRCWFPIGPVWELPKENVVVALLVVCCEDERL